MAKNISSWKECRDDRKVLSFAKEHGVNIREGKGDHFVMEKDGKFEVGYHREMSTGVAVSIFKFFKACGILCIFLLIFYRIMT